MVGFCLHFPNTQVTAQTRDNFTAAKRWSGLPEVGVLNDTFQADRYRGQYVGQQTFLL